MVKLADIFMVVGNVVTDDTDHLFNCPQDLTPLYENLGKTISPRSASLVLMDIVGAGNIDFKFVDAEYDDYEEFNYNEGYYPGKPDFKRVEA